MENYAWKFLELADQAWMDVLKEKIKEQIHANCKNLNDLARLIAESNHERWKKKLDEKSCCGCFQDKLKEFFHTSCQNQ